MTIPRLLALGATLTATGACADIQVRVMEPRPARPAGCAVDLFPEKDTGYDAEMPVAYAEARCRKRETCIDELRRQACAVGARGVDWVWEGTSDGQTEIDAYFVLPLANRDLLEWGPPSRHRGVRH